MDELSCYEKILPRAIAAGRDEAFASQLAKRLVKVPGLCRELMDWIDHRTMPGEYKVAGLSVPDIMVWQIDHFKAAMDRGRFDLKNNPDAMMLSAFDTMLNMAEDPETYLSKFSSETGTDYVGKYV